MNPITIKKTTTKKTTAKPEAGALIKAAAHKQDMSMAELSRRVGVSKGMMCQWLSGNRPVPSTRMDQILRVVGLDLSEVV